MTKNFKHITPVLPSSDIERDVKWYANTEVDPLLGGSVMKIFVDDIDPIFQEMVDRGSVSKDRIHRNTPWRTHEFGFYDLNKNAIFFVADVN